MSISRQLLREFRPLFRMLEEPISRPSFPASYFGFNSPFGRSGLFDTLPIVERPVLDVNEEGDKYVLEAEVPGVKKDNIEVRIGDAGRSVTIEGKVVEQRRQPEAAEVGDTTESKGSDSSTTVAAAKDEGGNQISTERTFVNNAVFRRTVWLPRPVDPNNVKARLDHGVLTVEVKKAEDKGSVVVPVE